jgi:hypothetical protein
MACRRINKLKQIIVVLVCALVLTIGICFKQVEGCDKFGNNNLYEKEYSQFIKFSEQEQKNYLAMTRDEKISKYGNL